jgi:hypothetical protein
LHLLFLALDAPAFFRILLSTLASPMAHLISPWEGL